MTMTMIMINGDGGDDNITRLGLQRMKEKKTGEGLRQLALDKI
jgi:hypothetical protein